jgi:hypothetical protein
MLKTFKDLRELDNMVGQLYAVDPKLKDTKFGYAYKRFVEKNYQKPLNDFQEAIMDARIDNALTNETTKELLKDPMDMRGFKYSKEGLKAVIKAENQLVELWNAKEIECTPYISSYKPENLSEEQTEAMTGLLI